MSPKVVIIGAGAFIFPQVLIRDMLAFEALRGTHFELVDIDLERARTTEQAARRLTEELGLAATFAATDDRRRALDGADFVICTFQVGSMDAYRLDVEIPREFGVDQPVGDTYGPGGVFRGLRSIAALKEIAADIVELCPDALFIQYANPMSANTWASSLLGVNTVGLCHSVQGTSEMLAAQLGVPYEEVTYDCAGVNHTAWFTTFRRGSEDLIPRLRDLVLSTQLGPEQDGPEGDRLHPGGGERVRAELMRLTGYFHTESSHHASEYWPWFRKSPQSVARYIKERWDFYEISRATQVESRGEEILAEVRAKGLRPSHEYGAFIVDSIVSGTRRVIYGNLTNNGVISNLPADACVEVACVVDGNGLRPVRYGELPAACAALNNVQINVHRLVVQAALSGDRELVHAAVALDPMTGAILELPEIRRMVDRMFDAEARWLPQFQPAPAAVG